MSQSLSIVEKIAAFLVAGVAIFFIVEGRFLAVGTPSAPDAGFFPLLISVLLLVCSLGIIASSFTSAPVRDEDSDTSFSARSWIALAAMLALLVYAFTVDRVGFIPCTIALMVVLMKGYGGMKWITAIGISVPLVGISFAGFQALGVPLPYGILAGLI